MTGKVLVVDDESVTRRLVGFTLRSLQIETTEAANATEALDKCSAVVFDLILVDINLPDMDGFKLVQRLRSVPSAETVPIIVFTARNNPDDEMRVREVGAEGLLYKPFSTQELRTLVNQHMRK